MRSAPVVLMPGFGHAERGIDVLRRHLERAGFTDVAVVDTANGGDIPHRADLLAHHVEALRNVTGSERIHIVAHNVSGVVARYFVQLLGGDAVVDTVVTIGTPHAGSTLTPVGLGPAAAQLRPGSHVLAHLDESARPSKVRWISYFCDYDHFVQPPTSAILKDPRLRAVNVLVAGHGHLSLSIPAPVCRSVAHQVAAAEGIPGYGSPVSALPGGVVRLDESDPERTAAIARSRAAHPSNSHPTAVPGTLVKLSTDA